MLSERSQAHIACFHLYKMSRKIHKERSRFIVTRDWRRTNAEHMLNGDEVSLWGDQNVLKTDSGGGYTTLWNLLKITEKVYTKKMAKAVKLISIKKYQGI